MISCDSEVMTSLDSPLLSAEISDVESGLDF